MGKKCKNCDMNRKLDEIRREFEIKVSKIEKEFNETLSKLSWFDDSP